MAGIVPIRGGCKQDAPARLQRKRRAHAVKQVHGQYGDLPAVREVDLWQPRQSGQQIKRMRGARRADHA
jgi:hypothetical protein